MKKKTRPVNAAGSILIGAIAISILMAIAGIGFLQVTASGLNNDTAALEDLKALCAAESGADLCLRWLRGYTGFPTAPAGNLKPFGNNPIYDTVNNMDVYVIDSVYVGGNGMAAASIKAAAFKHPSSGSTDASTFKKRVTIGNVQLSIFGIYCTFYDGFQAPTTGAYTWAGWSGRTFNGRFHMNNMCNVLLDQSDPALGTDSTKRVYFNGLVTIARPTDAGQIYGGNYGTGHNGNDYDSCLKVNWSSGDITTANLDQVFTDRYKANVEPIKLSIPRTDGISMWTDTSVHDQKFLLDSTKVRDEGDSSASRRPTLKFTGTTAHYQYYSGVSSAYKDTTYAISSSGTIFRSSKNLSVFGKVTGRVTVVTDSGKSILPVGTLVTSDYDSTGDTIPFSSNNMIGLISGKSIRFNDQWVRDTAAIAPTQEVAQRASIHGTDTTLNITAGIIAVKSCVVSGTALKGCEYWDGMWNICNPAVKVSYKYNLFGNHILGGYMPSIGVSSGNWVSGCRPGGLTFTHDPRMYKKLIQPPGFPGVSTVNGLYLLTIGGWKEDNKY